jgi:Na+-transporting methylmalonyl-CoA/oxaloacetate decarboxylase gamma subunit
MHNLPLIYLAYYVKALSNFTRHSLIRKYPHPKRKVKENVVQLSIIRNNTSILKLIIAIIISTHQII